MNHKNTKSILRSIMNDYSFLFSFIVLILIAIYFNPAIIRPANILTLLSNSTITGIIACGMTLVIISGQIDLSVGAIVSLTAGLGVIILNQTNSILFMFLFCLVFGSLLGMTNGALVSILRLPAFIATLATQTAYRSIITQIGQGGPFTVNRTILKSFSSIATGNLFGAIPHLPLFFFAVVLLTGFLLEHTKTGRYVYATGSNEIAAGLSGVKTNRTKLFVFSFVGLLAGLSAFLLSSRMSSVTASNAGFGYELDAIAAVAIGGTAMAGGRGKIVGSFFGAVMMQLISTILIAARIDPFLTGLVKGMIIIIAVSMQSANKANRLS